MRNRHVRIDTYNGDFHNAGNNKLDRKPAGRIARETGLGDKVSPIHLISRESADMLLVFVEVWPMSCDASVVCAH